MTSAVYAGTVAGSNTVADTVQCAAFVVGEDFAGMRSQALGLAERAGWRSTFCPVRPDRIARLALGGPAWLGRPFLRGHDGKALEDSPDLAQSAVVISVGGKGGAMGAALRSSRHPVVQVQNPRQNLSRFDLIVACRHDDLSGPNILVGRTAVHGLTEPCLRAARQVWQPRFEHLPRPLVAALVGGGNGRYRFTDAEAHRLGQVLVNTVKAEGGSLIVTPSRRTQPSALKILAGYVQQVNGVLWDGEGENPYVGLIACADSLVVTMDSVSMVSEAVAGEAPVTVFPLPGRSHRISHFIEELELAERVRVLDSTADRLPRSWGVRPLDDTPELVGEMHRRLGF
ncbi:mitochondrial fission ELM1 family protein [Acetobacter vaccinii]|uniref:Nucleoside-diphosphate sugar epimerase n=1 Tax=Acetobacter vaccinii TaxID=2592655 RepID=A0A5C1YTM3_9PROT|nr:mitochondrial fission ELM1 family protein [Acetobacter vaccinii]QEO18640.1 hypothetical protein FLP30_08240 [Acetobacter vaccinii]